MKNSTDKTKKLHSKFRKQFQTKPPISKGEINNLPSLTVPDLTLTIKQLLTNHSRGIQSDVAYNEPLYFNSEIPTIDDIVDLKMFKEDLKKREKLLQAKIKEENAAYMQSIQETPKPSKNEDKPQKTDKTEVVKK